METLDNMIERAYNMKLAMEELDRGFKLLKEKIDSEMTNLGENKHLTSDGKLTASITESKKYKYNNEAKMIEILEALGYDSYIDKKISATRFNPLLKGNVKQLTESLDGLYTETISTSLTLKEN